MDAKLAILISMKRSHLNRTPLSLFFVAKFEVFCRNTLTILQRLTSALGDSVQIETFYSSAFLGGKKARIANDFYVHSGRILRKSHANMT